MLWQRGWQLNKCNGHVITANQLDTEVVDKQIKMAVVIDVAILNDSNIRKTEHKKLEKYQELRKELKEMWRVKATLTRFVNPPYR